MLRKLMHKLFGWEYVLIVDTIYRAHRGAVVKNSWFAGNFKHSLCAGGILNGVWCGGWEPYLCGPELTALYEGVPALSNITVGIDPAADYKDKSHE